MALKPKTLLSCPDCGKTGVARWVRPGTHRQCDLFDLSSGFNSIDRGTKAGHFFVCQGCRKTAVEQDSAKTQVRAA